jgi:hypothetical protein
LTPNEASLLQQDGAFFVVSGQPIGLPQRGPPPKSGGEHIVPDGFSRSIRPSAAVADLVEAIWDWDIPDGDAATAFTMPPSTAPYFVVQYRTLTHCRWQLGGGSCDHKDYGHVLTQTQSGTFAISPRGPWRTPRFHVCQFVLLRGPQQPCGRRITC